MSGLNRSRCLACPVAEAVLIVLPWKLCSVEMTSIRPVTFRASLMTASLASAPLLEKKTRVRFGGRIPASSSTSRARAGE